MKIFLYCRIIEQVEKLSYCFILIFIDLSSRIGRGRRAQMCSRSGWYQPVGTGLCQKKGFFLMDFWDLQLNNNSFLLFESSTFYRRREEPVPTHIHTASTHFLFGEAQNTYLHQRLVLPGKPFRSCHFSLAFERNSMTSLPVMNAKM